ncbi:MAG: 16S rRNA (guanine(527)-N(7))-methyltransferase RsmG, partial [Candidatus Subteraquimicrobiales bacterium]|nr:16S rRNA (guanine(527)-N(7))-methyltransferase RsmG [Candidatus Subteraquimicrobiales bacterium]
MDSLKLLKEGAGQLNMCLNEVQLEALMRYLKELKDYNEHFRLVGSVEEEVVVVEHFLDSLSCLTSGLINGGKKVIDVGAGAGFPGLVLKIIRPEMTLTLLDSSNKKATFLQHMVDVLHLSRTEVVCARAEEFGREKQRETYDLAL